MLGPVFRKNLSVLARIFTKISALAIVTVQTSAKSARFPRHRARDAALLGREAHFSKAARTEREWAALVIPRRANYREQPDGGAPCVGTVAQRHVPALPRHERAGSALPERIRLPGIVGGS